MEKVRWDFLLLILVGAVCLLGGIYKYRQRRRLVKSGVRTKGIVVSVEQSSASRTTSNYHPIVKYTTFHNETITARYDIGEDMNTYSAGDGVDIIYDTANNREFIIDDTKTKLFGPIFIIAGVALILFAAVQYFFHPF